jgi:lysyl-tRNA synthetase class I
MENNENKPQWEPPCEKCERTMRLVGIEADDARPNTSLQTYECECGETSVFQITRMQGRA